MLRGWLLFVLVLAIGVLQSAGAQGQISTNADALVEQGVQARSERRDEDALQLFLQAYAVERSARALAQVALAEQALGRWVDAEKHLIEAASAPHDPWIEKHRAALDQALEVVRDQIASVEVTSKEPGAELWLNGVRVGALPQPLRRVAVGPLLIELRADRFDPFRQTVTLERREVLRIEPELHPKAVGTSEAPPASRLHDREALPTPALPSTRRTLAWTMLALGGALLGGALASHIAHEVNVNHYNDDSHCFYGALSREQRCGSVLGQAEVEGALAIAGYAGAAAAFATSSYLFLTVRRLPDGRPSSSRWDGVVGGTFSF
jgi:hypothetical protein